MTPDIIAQLHPPRLPEAFTTAGPADYLLAFGLGLAIAALVVWLLAPALQRRARPVPLADQLRAAQNLPPDEALLALAALARRQGLALDPAEQAALYRPAAARPQTGPDPVATLAARLRRGRR